MIHSAEDRELFLLETSSTSLNTRININEQNSRIKLLDWLFNRLKVSRGEKILDVGCGTGFQSLRFLKEVGSEGRVCATDISDQSIIQLVRDSQRCDYLETQVGDMINLRDMLDNSFSINKFDLAHSSYALYYANDHIKVLSAMKDSLVKNGRLAVFSPHNPHGMVEFVRDFCEIPVTVDQSLCFGPKVLEPFFRKNFWEVEVHFFQNELTLNNTQDFISLYKATTYFKENILDGIALSVESIIKKRGEIKFSKPGYLIIGSDKRK